MLFATGIVTLAACSTQPAIEVTRDSLMQTMDAQRGAVGDSVAIKADSNKKTIDSSFKAMQDSIQRLR